MLEFIDTDAYTFNPDIRVQYPHFTSLDLHIHAYLVGSKYEVSKLCDYAIDQYIHIGDMILSMGVTASSCGAKAEALASLGAASTNTDDAAATSTPAYSQHSGDVSPSAILERFLSSVVLLWKNTPDRHDQMREAVLELIKPHLNCLIKQSFFSTMMMDMLDFGNDIVRSLEEDGFDVSTEMGPAGLRGRSGVRFGFLASGLHQYT